MFQYAYDSFLIDIKENTDLITLEEAESLWEKYYSDCLDNLKEGNKPQMCIWQDCNSNTNYGNVLKEIDYRDKYEIKNGEYYKLDITKEKIK